MEKNATITVFDGSEPLDVRLGGRMEIIDTRINVYGKSVRFQIGVQNEMTPLSDLVPLARTICDKLLAAILEHPSNNPRYVSCRKGCSACCSYLVGLSMPEVFRMRQEFAMMPADDRIPILKTCLHAAFKILKQDISEPEINENTGLRQISKWYADLKLQCPFLSSGLCSIYRQRPLACREYYVKSLPDGCLIGGASEPEVVRLPVSVTEVLGKVAAELEGLQAHEAVILPLVLIGTDELSHRANRLWPAPEMVRHFVRILEQTAAQNTNAYGVNMAGIL